MGEVATPTDKEREETRRLASKIVQSVIDDAAMPLPFTVYNTRDVGPAFEPESVADFVFMLAQEIELQRAERDNLLTTVQRESTAVNECHGVIAHLVGVIARIGKAKDMDEVKTIVEMSSTTTDEWRAGIWKPGPHDDAADWKSR